MSKAGKRFRKLEEQVDSTRLYPLNEAMELVKKTASTKFDETVEVAVQLGIDARKSDQNVRGTAILPRGIGKTTRVAVFATGTNAEAAKEAGADIVGFEDLVESVKKGEIEFDSCIAEPDAMKAVATVGRILGPKGLMPNPKTGTVRTDIAEAVKEAKAGKVNFRIDRAGIVHCGIGKASFDEQALTENFHELLRALKRAQPPAAKGQYFRKVSLSTTMGPGVRVDATELART
ncbi:MAG: 50S ribosomal protein L1 [Acidiferrobacterales bacterium]|nr:50S ribosomal protein L1 [Acidiferrobacterales bacterium]